MPAKRRVSRAATQSTRQRRPSARGLASAPGSLKLRALSLYPPLAFARLGRSKIPCDAFDWDANDVRPRGTGKTTVRPMESLQVALDGTVTATAPTEIVFKDEAGFRPICPFFELHGEWDDGKAHHSGPITLEVLERCGFHLSDLRWRVHVANLKPYHYTLRATDRIEAELDLPGDQTQPQVLRGVTPMGAARATPAATVQPTADQNDPAEIDAAAVFAPLVPNGAFVPLGAVQLTRPSPGFEELRLRFTPPGGYVYGPKDLTARLENLRRHYDPARDPRRWTTFALPEAQLLLDPAAAWCAYVPPGPRDNPDTNTVPSSLYAFEDIPDTRQRALGLVDDMSDGLITCELPGVKRAVARVVVTPPDFAPDRRPFVSLADDLKDRVDRDDVLEPSYVADAEQTSLELRDLMERVAETVGLFNADFQNDRSGGENADIVPSTARRPGRDLNPVPKFDLIGEDPLPLTARARERHRRFAALEVFETILREHPELLDTIVREPVSSSTIYDARMPAMMRGSDGNPLHLTRRQYQLLQAWAESLRKTAAGSP